MRSTESTDPVFPRLPPERTFTESEHKQNKKSLVYSIEKLNSIQGVTHDNLKAEILYLFKFCKIHFRN